MSSATYIRDFGSRGTRTTTITATPGEVTVVSSAAPDCPVRGAFADSEARARELCAEYEASGWTLQDGAS